MIIKMNDIGKIYKNGKVHTEALKGVNISIHKGEFISIMGASGSGKSTLMNIMGCLDRATSGTYKLEGVDISNISDNELGKVRNLKIGFVFQAFNLLPKMDAFKNVELPMLYAGVPSKERKEKAMYALDRVGLSDRMHHKPTEMSGGQKQRVAIARALVNNPAIILADEPTGNLDSVSSEEIMSIFQGINRNGVTIVLVTHEPDIAEHTKRVLKFKDGMLVSDLSVTKSINADELLKEKKNNSL
ncbi:ABC transporter ATP-binding protein [Herbivorax sp. ANBcel31]|uniref:ABC transporter ATP-binding protein n=1 Tax=Herbivorax sp. ANBcel31 TaxID=3069754 RepID=UPI0027AF1880|nr:ABC transporter ATP-binding protein [Herbivorax sp. ANBcel31]MDQ2087568.1 ABC transporter ATP-binding protein [Herbivorax sp. ANBcel31]